MKKNTPGFKIKDAVNFAKAHGLQADAERIINIKVHPRTQEIGQYLSGRYAPNVVRKGYFVELFEAHGLMEDFEMVYWPGLHTAPHGQDRRRKFLNLKDINERLLNEENHNQDVTSKDSLVSHNHKDHLRRDAQNNTAAEDVFTVACASDLDSTTKELLINARIGQGKFREDVLQLWDHKCSVTGSVIKKAIRASHIKPWRDSTNAERLDPKNGLPLVASLDALFDGGLITFDGEGRMLVSSHLGQHEREIFGVSGKKLSQKPSSETATYLHYHQTMKFQE